MSEDDGTGNSSKLSPNFLRKPHHFSSSLQVFYFCANDSNIMMKSCEGLTNHYDLTKLLCCTQHLFSTFVCCQMWYCEHV